MKCNEPDKQNDGKRNENRKGGLVSARDHTNNLTNCFYLEAKKISSLSLLLSVAAWLRHLRIDNSHVLCALRQKGQRPSGQHKTANGISLVYPSQNMYLHMYWPTNTRPKKKVSKTSRGLLVCFTTAHSASEKKIKNTPTSAEATVVRLLFFVVFWCKRRWNTGKKETQKTTWQASSRRGDQLRIIILLTLVRCKTVWSPWTCDLLYTFSDSRPHIFRRRRRCGLRGNLWLPERTGPIHYQLESVVLPKQSRRNREQKWKKKINAQVISLSSRVDAIVRAASANVVFNAGNVIQIRNENNDARQRDHKTIELCSWRREVIPYRQLRSQIVCYRMALSHWAMHNSPR